MSGPAGIRPTESSNTPAELAQPLLTIREVAAFLKVNERTVRRLVVREGLPCIHLGTRLRFSQRNVLRWVSAREEGRGFAETS
jgi:excisionase family DNA binding protein